jgi:diguanylate cyclase (GGDEF)-like protein
MSRVRVVIAEDQPEVRAALATLLATDPALEVVGMASDGDEAVALVAVQQPDVAVLDVKMPGGGGVAAAQLIRHAQPGVRVVALSAYEDRSTVLEMLRAGAVGYVAKGSPAADILTAVRRAAEGLSTLSPTVSAELVHELGNRLRAEEETAAATASTRRHIEGALDGDLRIVHQPVVDLSSGLVVGVEALARFPDVDGASPDAWFAAAADLGLRVELELAAFRAALETLDDLPAPLHLGVNLSPDTVVAEGVWDELPPELLARLVIELTEHAPVADYDRLRAVLRPLREWGARVAVDDAGAGFASLRHILLLEADIIKIDASLTREVAGHRGRRALAAALCSFAVEVGATVVAEGIEHPDDLGALQGLGVEQGQGYLLGAPGPPEEVELGARAVVLERRGALAVPPPAVASGDVDAGGLVRRLLRRLLRVGTPEQAVAELVGFVHDLGGWTVRADEADDTALPVDVGLGVLPAPLLAAAPPDGPARRALEAHLPTVVEDVRAVVVGLDRASQAARDAVLDPLTGLLNRRGAGTALTAGGEGDVVAVLDLDHFKRLNDRFGHDAGDRVLRVLGDVLRGAIREADTCWRYGGEEFALLLPATSIETAVAVLERIADRWRRERPFPVTFSAGVAPIDRDGIDAAIAAADAALYRAKANGRNRIETAAPAATGGPA